MATTKMRGLNEFISDIRACKDRDSETKRIEQEIAKIRERFTNEKGLNSYQRKKYVWKLLYIHILGYEIDFGHFEAANLINSPNYEEKYTGYISSSLLVDEKNDEIWKGLANSIETDIRSRNENAQSLAFSMIGTSAPEVLVNCLSEHIVDAALSQKHSVNIRKKAILCLLRMLRKYPDKFDPKKWLAQLTDMFESKYIVLSFLSSAASLLLGIQAISNPEHFRDIAPKIVRLLHKLVINKECSLDYLYYQTPNPWLQIKLFKILEGWSPVDDKSVLAMIEEILSKILKRTDATKSVNKNNTDYGILFEAVNVVIHYDKRLNPKLMTDVAKILVVFVQSNQANIKYLGLEAMCRLSVKQNLSENLTYILPALVDQDISIRRRALDLLYLISTPNNANQIVKELLGYLETRADPLIKDELVLKIAILAEKFA
jgi:AP-2 complex subunit alpha